MLHLLDIFQHMYPDTNMHELDLSWILKEIAEFDKQLDELEERVIEAAVKASKEYIDEQMVEIHADFQALSNKVDNLERTFNEKTAEIEREFNSFTSFITEQFTLLQARMDAFEERVQNEIIGVEASIDVKIEANNEYLLNEISRELGKIKVINYFTGELITVQAMFDYLAVFHLENPITYTELASASIDYDALAALHMTYTELAIKGKSFIIP